MFPPYFPIEAKKRGLDKGTIGLCMGLWFVAYCITALYMPRIYRVASRMVMLTSGLFLLVSSLFVS